MARILIIDPQSSFRNSLRDRLEYEKHEVTTAEKLETEMAPDSKDPFDIVICENSIFLADKEIAEHYPPSTAILVTSDDNSIEGALEAVRQGAYDYFTTPLDMNRLFETIRKIEEERNSVPKQVQRRARPAGVIAEDEMVGQSQQMMRMRELIAKIAPTDAKVLILGDNGTGKELVARSLHLNSNRSSKPFVEVNCAAIPSELIESELFGHAKGAFTSAVRDHRGKFEQADGGTIFLDEIGDMSLAAQAKVLRTLQENKIYRVGSEKEVGVDARVIAATNKDLWKEIALGNFREDLFHRLSVIALRVPTLNERQEDIPLLVTHFLEIFCREYNSPIKIIESAAMRHLCCMQWSGNIRQLRNVMERLVVLCGNSITLSDVLAYTDRLTVKQVTFREYEA